MRLTPCELPVDKAMPKYLEWRPMLQEFIDSGSACSRIDDIKLESRHIGQIRMCIDVKFPKQIALRILGGVPYLMRKDNVHGGNTND